MGKTHLPVFGCLGFRVSSTRFPNTPQRRICVCVCVYVQMSLLEGPAVKRTKMQRCRPLRKTWRLEAWILDIRGAGVLNGIGVAAFSLFHVRFAILSPKP